MDKFWNYLPDLLKDSGFEWLGQLINFLVTTGIGSVIFLGGKWIYNQHKERKEKQKQDQLERERKDRQMQILKDLHPYFSKVQVERAYDLYVETQGQNVPPSRDHEPRQTHAHTYREPLIPKFIKDSFSQEKDENRFYLVLADSGMGKTTFMINLYLRYLEKTEGKEFQMKLYPLGYPGVEDEIKEMVKKGIDRNTILLLDAFDEDAEAARDYKKRMDDLVKLVKNFREVLITSRTQFFPNEAAIPGEINVPKPDLDKPGFHTFKVTYVSPFSKDDIASYLERKFPGYDYEAQENRRNAQHIIDRSPKLMVRPMLLANIDDLLNDSKRSYVCTYEIYEVLIDKWLDREASRKPKAERMKFRQELARFSLQTALVIYKNWILEERLYISRKELDELAKSYNIQLAQIDMTSRSLLNRDAVGNCKFSHKSILEYFLAQEARQNKEFSDKLSFSGMDMVEKFLMEYKLPEMVRVEGGNFMREKYKVTLLSFEISKYPVTQQQWQAIMGNNPSHFKGDDLLPVENVSWEDVQVFIKKLNEQANYNFRLPTEAEWEFAARGGRKSQECEYAGSNDLDEVGWYWKNSGDERLDGSWDREVIEKNNGRTHPVGQKLPNELGLYDMSGNVWEWCQDWYGKYPAKHQTNPPGPESGDFRVIRGGCWLGDASFCRVAVRNFDRPSYRDYIVGFRLARTVNF